MLKTLANHVGEMKWNPYLTPYTEVDPRQVKCERQNLNILRKQRRLLHNLRMGQCFLSKTQKVDKLGGYIKIQNFFQQNL